MEQGWRAIGENHPLAPLARGRIGGLGPQVREGPANPFGARYFQLWLGERGEKALALLGLYHRGEYPGYNWIEVISISPRLALPWGSRPLMDTPLERALFRRLGEAVPPGGHLMVEYESPERVSTALALRWGVPPLATPIGRLLWEAGCGAGFKDWAFAEGGREGPRKLQGFKAPSPELARSKEAELAKEMRAFLAQPSSSQLQVKEARHRARRWLRRLSKAAHRGDTS